MSIFNKLLVLALLSGGVYLLSEVYSFDNTQNEIKQTDVQEEIVIAMVERESPNELSILDKKEQPKKMYKWVDEKGNLHFGDKLPDNLLNESEEVEFKEVATTKFKETTKSIDFYVPPKRVENKNQSTLSEKQTRCKKLKEQVANDLKSREKRAGHNSFNAREARLQNNRAEIIMNCH